MQSAGGCGREIVGVLMERLPSATAAGDGASHDSGHWHGIVSSGLHGAISSNGSRQDTTEYSDLLCCNGPGQWRCRGSADLAVGSDGISAGEDCTEASDSERQSAQRAAGSSVGHGVRFSTPLSTGISITVSSTVPSAMRRRVRAGQAYKGQARKHLPWSVGVRPLARGWLPG